MHADLSIVCKFGGDPAVCLREEAICAKVYRRTDDGRANNDVDRDDVTSLPAADCSTFLLLRREKLDHQWFEAESVVRPMPRLMIIIKDSLPIGVVSLEVQRPVVGRQPSRSARVHGDTGT